MKVIIYFLVIFNLGFAAWHFQGLNAGEETGSGDAEMSHENQLILLTELQQNKQTEANAKLCYSLGPFAKKSQADKAQERLKGSNLETRRIQLRDTSRSGYWVILPASPSRKAAKKQVAKLVKLKIKDYFLVAKGTHENAISLGVYSQKKLARNRVDEIIRLGFIPRMETVALPRKVYWLNWYKDAETQPEYTVLSEIKKKFSQISKIERSCK